MSRASPLAPVGLVLAGAAAAVPPAGYTGRPFADGVHGTGNNFAFFVFEPSGS